MSHPQPKRAQPRESQGWDATGRGSTFPEVTPGNCPRLSQVPVGHEQDIKANPRMEPRPGHQRWRRGRLAGGPQELGANTHAGGRCLNLGAG